MNQTTERTVEPCVSCNGTGGKQGAPTRQNHSFEAVRCWVNCAPCEGTGRWVRTVTTELVPFKPELFTEVFRI